MGVVTYAETSLVKRHRGTMPIILTCPHDGTEQPPGVQARTGADPSCKGGDRFNDGRDHNPAIITEGVASRILEVTGLSPYVVIAKFHRKYIDANRPPLCAYSEADAQPFYDFYHDRIDKYIRQVIAQNNTGFLFDIHGHSRDDSIYLGTKKGKSLLSLDYDRLFMRHGFHGLLSAVGDAFIHPLYPFGYKVSYQFRYTVLPPDTTIDSGLGGGFTVEHYSPFENPPISPADPRTPSDPIRPPPFNCIQIEIPSTILNRRSRRRRLIDELSFALINFVRRYAPF